MIGFMITAAAALLVTQSAAESARGEKVKDFVISLMQARSPSDVRFASRDLRYLVGGYVGRTNLTEGFGPVTAAIEGCRPVSMSQLGPERDGSIWYQVELSCPPGKQFAFNIAAKADGVDHFVLNVGGYPPMTAPGSEQ